MSYCLPTFWMRNSVSVCSFNLNSVFMRNIKHLSLLKSLFVCKNMYRHGSTHGRAHMERPEDSLDCYHTHHPSLSTASVLGFFCFLLPSPWRSSEITDAHYLGPHTWLMYTLIRLPAFLTIVFTLKGHLRPLCELSVQFSTMVFIRFCLCFSII